jgi:purine nucleoside permease
MRFTGTLRPNLLFALVFTFAVSTLPPAEAARPLRPKVVVVAYFELGEDTGDKPGELQNWVEREHLDRVITVPGVFNHVRANRDGSIIALKVGPLSINPAVNIVALGNSPLFDLSKSYWLLQGICGVTPLHGTTGSAVWTTFVVDGDAISEIDARELPSGWDTNFFPLLTDHPYPTARVQTGGPEDPATWTEPVFHISPRHDRIMLNPTLADWAFKLTRRIELEDTEPMRRQRASYAGFPEAQRRPGVLIGGSLSTERFWLGAKMDDWANRWMDYASDSRSVLVTAAENDIGSLVAIESLGEAGKADPNRVLLLRAASDFTRPPPGGSLAKFISTEQHGSYTAYDAAIDALYRVGSPVVHRLLESGSRPEN